MKKLLFMTMAMLILFSGTAMAQMANQTSADQRIVYDMANDVYFYPMLTDMLRMTRAQQQAFIDKLNMNGYCNTTDWKFASLVEANGVKDGLASVALETQYVIIEPGPIGDSTPRMAWPIYPKPEEYFTVTDVITLPPIFGDMPLQVVNGRTDDDWGLRRDPDMSVGIRKGEAADHFMVHPMMTPGEFATMMYNYDQHYYPDDAVVHAFEFMQPGETMECGAWVSSIIGPSHLDVAVDLEPDNMFNCFVFKEEGIHTLAILGQEFFDVALQVDPATITLNNMGIHFVDDAPLFEIRDMNGDGIEDLVVMIDVVGDKYPTGDYPGIVKGYLKPEFGGTAIMGADEMTVLAKKGDPDFIGWYNMMDGDQRLVYDAMLDAWFYPFLNDMLDMTRSEHQQFIDQMNANKYGNITDWVFANYEQSDNMKMSLGMMADNLIEFAFPGTPEGAPRTPSSPYLAWPVVPADYFDVTSIQFLPPIFGDMPIPTLNGRIYSGWSVRRDGMDMSLPPDVAIRLGEADDHFVAHAMMTPGMDATITFNHDTHDLMDHETTRDGFPGPLGAWVASVKGPEFLKVAIDFKPTSDANIIYDNGLGAIPVAIFGHENFDIVEMVDVSTLQLDGLNVKVDSRGHLVVYFKDLNDDGIKDLLVYFVNELGVYEVGMKKATLTGFLKDNYGCAMIKGVDAIIVKSRSKTTSKAIVGQNYPNPFNPETEIRFEVVEPAPVKIVVYNTLGQQVKILTDAYYEMGDHRVRWDGKDTFGYDVASGVYLYQFKSEDIVSVQRMLLIR